MITTVKQKNGRKGEIFSNKENGCLCFIYFDPF